MTGLTDLQKTVQDLGNAVPAAITYISNLQTQNSSLTAQLAAANATIASLQASQGSGDSDADVETQAQAIEAQVTALNNAVGTQPVTASPAV